MALRATDNNHELVTTYLHMTDPSDFQPGYAQNIDGKSIMFLKMKAADVDFYRFLYREVGDQWAWRDRLLLSDDELEAELSKPGVSVHVLYVDGTPAGYVELGFDGAETEILYFGLRSEFHGCGLGKHLLSYGIERAWGLGSNRVHVHTCNLDGPHALNNYMKRGFKIFNVKRQPMPNLYQ
jgi:GNAT superfamily N-acetyltransferase